MYEALQPSVNKNILILLNYSATQVASTVQQGPFAQCAHFIPGFCESFPSFLLFFFPIM